VQSLPDGRVGYRRPMIQGADQSEPTLGEINHLADLPSFGAAGGSVSVAESFTGGWLALRLVEIPGSGDWFKGGVVAYTDEVKRRLLDVDDGPVISREAAMQMARAVRELIRTDIGVATTGVAGPDTQEGRSVGTVYVGVSSPAGTEAFLLELHGCPTEIRRSAVEHAFERLCRARGEIRRANGASAEQEGRGGLRLGLASAEGPEDQL